MHTFEYVLDIGTRYLISVQKVFAGHIYPAANDLKTVSSDEKFILV